MTQAQLYGCVFEPIRTRGYRRAVGIILARKIKNLRTVLGLNQAELAKRLKVTQATVSRWERGSMPEGPKLAQLAEMAGESVKTFIDGTPNIDHVALLGRYWVRGEVAAGVFAAAYEWPQTEWTPYSGGSHIDVPEGARYGLITAGESMNQIYPLGTILDCVAVEYADELKSGQRVIVERHRADGDVEATVKEYVRSDDGSEWLVPRSSNPAFLPIAANDPGEGITEVRVVAVVVGSYRPE